MGFFKSLQNIVKKANDATNKVMKVTDPIGGYLKEYTETKSQAKVNSLLTGMMGGGAPQQQSDDGSPTTITQPKAVSDESLDANKGKAFDKVRKRRQGVEGGATLLTGDEESQLEKRTLLGM
jgi:hypothetical protein